MDLHAFTILSIGIFLGFFVQGTTGFAAAIISFPIILSILDLHQASALIAIHFFVFSAVLVPKYWHQIDKKILKTLALSSIIGMILGVQVLKYADLLILKKILGLLILTYVIFNFLRKKPIKHLNKLGRFMGFAGGFTSGLFSHGSSIFIMYINNKIHDAKTVRATLIGILAVGNIFRTPLLIQNHIITLNSLELALYTAPAFALGTLSGHYLHKYLPDRHLKTTILAFLTIAGILLIIR